MLMPGPGMAPLSGPPSAFALSIRPWLLAVFFLFIPVAVARFLVVDVIGGIFLLLTGGIGWYALKGSMDISWLLCLSIILFLNALFDAFILVARAMDTKYPLFGDTLSMQANVIHGILCAGPVVEFVSAIICWRIYRDFMVNLIGEDEYMAMDDGGLAQGPPAGAGLGGLGARNALLTGPRSSTDIAQGGPERRPGFEAFAGQGHRLED